MKKTLTRMVKYFRLYFALGNKELAQMAYKSAKEYYATRPHTKLDFTEYQRGYKSAYRRVYAKSRLESN